MPPASAPSPSGAWWTRAPPAGPGGGGQMSSGAWKRGPEIAVGVISLWEQEPLAETKYDAFIIMRLGLLQY